MHARPRGSQVVLTAALALIAAGVLAVLHLAPLPDTNIWWREAQNASHIVLFFMCAIITGLLARRFLISADAAASQGYYLAFGFTCTLAIATELMQMGTSREASMADFIRDVAGASAGLLILAASDQANGWSQRSRIIATVTAILVTVLAGLNFFRWTAAYVERRHDFPQLTDFESFWAAPFIELTDSRLAPLPAPAGLTQTRRSQVTLLQIRQGRWPGLAHLEPYPDWTGFATFAVDIYNPSDLNHDVILRIHDRSHNGDYEDRFSRDLSLGPGLNQVRITLEDIARAPAGRPMNLREVANFNLFSVQPAKAFDLYLSNFTLLEQGASSITSDRNIAADVRR